VIIGFLDLLCRLARNQPGEVPVQNRIQLIVRWYPLLAGKEIADSRGDRFSTSPESLLQTQLATCGIPVSAATEAGGASAARQV